MNDYDYKDALPLLSQEKQLLLSAMYRAPTEEDVLAITDNLNIENTSQNCLLPLAHILESIGYPKHLEYIKPRMNGIIRYFKTNGFRAIAPLIMLHDILSNEGIEIILINDAAIFNENITLIRTIHIAIPEAKRDPAVELAVKNGFAKRYENTQKIVLEKDNVYITIRKPPKCLMPLFFDDLSRTKLQDRDFLTPSKESLFLILIYVRQLDHILLNAALPITSLTWSVIEMSKGEGLNWQSIIEKGENFGLSELMYLSIDIIKLNCSFISIPETRKHNPKLALDMMKLKEMKRKKDKASRIRRYLIELKIINIEYDILKLNIFPGLNIVSKKDHLLRKNNTNSLLTIFKRIVKKLLNPQKRHE